MLLRILGLVDALLDLVFGIDYGANEALVKSDGAAMGIKEGMVDGTTLVSDDGLVLGIAFGIYNGSDKGITPGPDNLDGEALGLSDGVALGVK